MSTMILKNVRLSYPCLFEAKSAFPGQPAKFSAAFLLDKKEHAEQIKAIKAAITETAKAKWGDKLPKLTGMALRDGAEKEDKEGYGPGVMFINTSNTVRPQVVDRNPAIPLTAQDAKPYAGCFVNAHISFWAQDNQYGKKVNANLHSVQFVRDGEAFGEFAPPADAVFEDLSGEESSGEAEEDPLGLGV